MFLYVFLPVSDGCEPRDEGEDEVDDPHDDDDGEAGAEQSKFGVQHPVGKKDAYLCHGCSSDTRELANPFRENSFEKDFL